MCLGTSPLGFSPFWRGSRKKKFGGAGGLLCSRPVFCDSSFYFFLRFAFKGADG